MKVEACMMTGYGRKEGPLTMRGMRRLEEPRTKNKQNTKIKLALRNPSIHHTDLKREHQDPRNPQEERRGLLPAVPSGQGPPHTG